MAQIETRWIMAEWHGDPEVAAWRTYEYRWEHQETWMFRVTWVTKEGDVYYYKVTRPIQTVNFESDHLMECSEIEQEIRGVGVTVSQ